MRFSSEARHGVVLLSHLHPVLKLLVQKSKPGIIVIDPLICVIQRKLIFFFLIINCHTSRTIFLSLTDLGVFYFRRRGKHSLLIQLSLKQSKAVSSGHRNDHSRRHQIFNFIWQSMSVLNNAGGFGPVLFSLVFTNARKFPL